VINADLSPDSRDPAEAEQGSTASYITEQTSGHCDAQFHSIDVCNAAAIDNLVAETVQQFGRLDIMVANAGIAVEVGPGKNPIWETTTETFEKTLAINVTGVFNCVRAAGKQMITQTPFGFDTQDVPLRDADRGWILTAGSVASHIGFPHAPSYVISKHAVLGMTKTAAIDLAPYGVHVNSYAPGFIMSPMTVSVLTGQEDLYKQLQPLKGIGQPEDVASVAVMLASSDARFMTGTSVLVDGGYVAQ
jgi:NAD(P)-dependent dehydrogenase (short-subunit alcohol dehydrogenase family)